MKKTGFLIIILALLLLLSACAPPPVEENSSLSEQTTEEQSADVYISSDELPAEAKADIAFLKPFLEKSINKRNERGYLYVVDKDGNPVENLHCYNEGGWYEPGMEGAGKHGSFSMPGGIVPVSMLNIFDGTIYLTLVNHDIPGDPELKNIEVSAEKLLSGEVYKVIWEYDPPCKTILTTDDHITVNVKMPDGADMSRYIVTAAPYYKRDPPEPGEETNPAMGMSFSAGTAANISEEFSPQIGSNSPVRLWYLGSDGTAVIRCSLPEDCEFIEITITNMDGSIISVPSTEKEEYSFIEEAGLTEYFLEP